MLLGAQGPLTDDQARSMRQVNSNTDYLASLIDDILDITKLEAGRMEFAPRRVDLGSMTSSVLGLLRAKADEYGVALDDAGAAAGAAVWADEQGLRRVLVNLVSNALKFTPIHGYHALGPGGARPASASPLIGQKLIADR